MKTTTLKNALIAASLAFSPVLAGHALAQDHAAQAEHHHGRCGQQQAMEQLAKRNPQAVVDMQTLQDEVLEVMQARRARSAAQNGNARQGGAGGPDPDSVIYIPTVVHVVYNTPAQNISTAQVRSQIRVLNEDYAKLNVDFGDARSEFRAVAGAANIQFCLAEWDPDGNATDGIVRVETTEASFDNTDSPAGWDNVKNDNTNGSTGWPRNQYLNIWVCNLEDGGGILGYAYPPGGSSALDGVVISYRYFGDEGTASPPYNLGRTTTHEVGHWLGLRHTWGDGGCGVDDGFDDTPDSDGPNYGCPNPFSAVSCGTDDMFENYMDYTDDRCMVMFSAEQAEFMRDIIIRNGRTQLLSSERCYFNTSIADPGADDQDGIRLWPNPASGQQVQWGLEAASTKDGMLTVYDAMGRLVHSRQLAVGFQNGTLSLDGFAEGVYTVVLESGSTLRQHRLVVVAR